VVVTLGYYQAILCQFEAFLEGCVLYVAADCQLAMLSPSSRKRFLPQAASEEEIVDGQEDNVGKTRPANQSKPSTKFLSFEISSDDGYSTRADNWNGKLTVGTCALYINLFI